MSSLETNRKLTYFSNTMVSNRSILVLGAIICLSALWHTSVAQVTYAHVKAAIIRSQSNFEISKPVYTLPDKTYDHTTIRSVVFSTPDNKNHHQAFFCEIEDQIESRVRLPVRIRLGETSYVDRLEGKYGHLLR